MRSRYYSPNLRQFLSADSYMGDLYHPASLNPYSYVEGNPVRYIDPMGYAAEPFDLKSASAWLSTYQYLQYPGSYVTGAMAETMLFGYEDALSGGPDNYITMQEHHERLYEQTHSGAVHSSHFIQKPLGERLLSAAEIWQRDGLRAALYETGGFLEKGVAIFDNYQKWGYSTEPMGRKTYPSTAEMIHFLFEDIPSYSDLAISSGISTGIATVEVLEIGGKSKVFYNTVSVVATAVFVIPDVLNTWTEDSGNTNFKRLQKTGIQIAGAAASFGVGYASGKVMVAVSSYTGSIQAGIAAAEATNAIGGLIIQRAQTAIYEAWEIH